MNSGGLTGLTSSLLLLHALLAPLDGPYFSLRGRPGSTGPRRKEVREPELPEALPHLSSPPGSRGPNCLVPKGPPAAGFGFPSALPPPHPTTLLRTDSSGEG